MGKKSKQDPKDPKPAVVGITPVKTETPTSVEVQHIGRPSELNQAIADAICEHIEEGASLRSFCEQEGAPSKPTVLRWLRNSAAFRAQYAEARARGMDAHAEEILAIADESGLDVLGMNEDTGRPIVDGEAIARARLRIDARKWLMSKLAPKKYGDKVEVEHSGEQTHTIKFKRG